MRIASDGGDRGGRTVLSASGRRGLALGDGGQRDADPRQLYPRLLLLLVMLLLLLLLLLVLVMLLLVAPLRHGVESSQRLTGKHAASCRAEVQELENVRRRVEVVDPWRPRRRRVARRRRRGTGTQRGTRGGAPVALQVAVPPVSVAQRRHVLSRLRSGLGTGPRLRVRAGLTSVVATLAIVVIVGQRTHHLAPRIVRQ